MNDEVRERVAQAIADSAWSWSGRPHPIPGPHDEDGRVERKHYLDAADAAIEAMGGSVPDTR